MVMNSQDPSRLLLQQHASGKVREMLMSTQLAVPSSPNSQQQFAAMRCSRRENSINHYASSDDNFEESDDVDANGGKLRHTMEQRGNEVASTDNNNAHQLQGIVETVVNKPNSNQEKSRQRGDNRGVVTQLSISVRKSARDLKNVRNQEESLRIEVQQEDQQDANDPESAAQRGTRLLPQEQAQDENRSTQDDHLLQNDRITTQPVFTPDLSQNE